MWCASTRTGRRRDERVARYPAAATRCRMPRRRLMLMHTTQDETRSLTGLFDEAAVYRSGRDHAALLAFAIERIMRAAGTVEVAMFLRSTAQGRGECTNKRGAE